MTVSTLNERIVEFKSTIDEIVKILEQTEDSLLYKKPSAEEWSAMQIVAHVLEAVDYWVTDLEALLIVPGAKWGRNHEHVRRLAAVEETVVANLSKEDAITLLQKLVPETEAALTKVTAEDLTKTAPSYNPNFDGKPLSFLVDHLIVKHVSGHLDQIERHLKKLDNNMVI